MVCCAYIADAGAAGAKSVGISAPATGDCQIIAVEVRGSALFIPLTGGYALQEDGTSKIILEDDSGFWIEEETGFHQLHPV
jgi:hypothetical protein